MTNALIILLNDRIAPISKMWVTQQRSQQPVLVHTRLSVAHQVQN